MAEVSVGGLVDGVEFTSRHVMTRTGRQTLTKTILVNQPHGESFTLSRPRCFLHVTIGYLGLGQTATGRRHCTF